MNKVVLINLWFGEIPEYFKYHYETCINNKSIDFLFITDQNVNFSSSNYKVINIDLQFLKNRIKNTIGIDYEFSSNRNICQLKCALGDIFYDEIKDYLYWGIYDIDTLFGDFNKFILPLIDEYDIISFGVKGVHDRISGPLMLIKNTIEYNKLYKRKFTEFVNKLYNYEVDSFDETEFNAIVNDDKNIKVKILYDVCNFSIEKQYPLYDSFWSGGQLYINEQEKLIHHFIDKNNISFNKIGNSILSFHKKYLLEDFFWVTYFTNNYEDLAKGLLESISKFSNRKCIVYTINYTSNLSFQKNEQFIFRRLDFDIGEKDNSNRYVNLISLKPTILYDVTEFKLNSNFIYIDTDCYLTVNADSTIKYIQNIENYPLLNSHVHDRLYANDIYPTREWVSTLDILSEATGIPIIIFPRRKANLIVFNNNCRWFFKEQIDLYEKYKNTKPGIFRLQDEDSANILLSKYNFKESLPVIDMEESSDIDMNKIKNYSYNMTGISNYVVLPKNKNDISIFHGFKNPNFIKKINDDYLPNVIESERLSISYENRTLLIRKYGFFNDKKIETPVHFKIKNLNGDIIYELNEQDLYRYWLFYIGNCFLNSGNYIIQIEDKFNNIIFNKILAIK